MKEQEEVKRNPRGWATSVRNVLFYTVLAVVALLVGLRAFGLKSYTIMSGSMTPTFPVGSLVYVKSVDPASLEIGDIITFMTDSNTVVTHRIIEIEKAEENGTEVLRFRTKGDANASADEKLIHESNILGRADFSLPLLGYLAYNLRRPPGIYIALVVATLLLVSVFSPKSEKKVERKEVVIDL